MKTEKHEKEGDLKCQMTKLPSGIRYAATLVDSTGHANAKGMPNVKCPENKHLITKTPFDCAQGRRKDENTKKNGFGM